MLLASLRGGSPRDISQIMGAILSSMYPSVMVPFSSLFTTSWAIIMELYGNYIIVLFVNYRWYLSYSNHPRQ